MKRIAALTLLIIFLLSAVIACGSSNVCPAYSNNDTEQTDGQDG